MAFDAAAVQALFDAARTHAQTLGLFDRVNTHEPKNAPGRGLSASIWVQAIAPVGRASGTGAVSGRVELHIRVYASMLKEPQDSIDPEILSAISTLMGEYSGAFTLGGTVRNIDLLGMHGTPLSAQAGYLNQDGKFFRVMVLTVPVIINDMWTEAA